MNLGVSNSIAETLHTLHKSFKDRTTIYDLPYEPECSPIAGNKLEYNHQNTHPRMTRLSYWLRLSSVRHVCSCLLPALPSTAKMK